MLVKLTGLPLCIRTNFMILKYCYFIKHNIGDCNRTPCKDAERTVAGDGDITVDERAMYIFILLKARYHVLFQYHYSSPPHVMEFYEIFVVRFITLHACFALHRYAICQVVLYPPNFLR
jgi:hypothetical protein